MSDDNTIIPINGPATVNTAPDTQGNWCHMPDRSKLDEGTYLVYAEGPGTTRWTMDRCGPHPTPVEPAPTPVEPAPAPVVPVATPAASVAVPADPPVLPSTGSETTIAGIGLALVVIGVALRKVAS